MDTSFPTIRKQLYTLTHVVRIMHFVEIFAGVVALLTLWRQFPAWVPVVFYVAVGFEIVCGITNYFASMRIQSLTTCSHCRHKLKPKQILDADSEPFLCTSCHQPFTADLKEGEF